MKLESYFEQFRKKTIGVNSKIHTPFGEKDLIYADWTASGRLYEDIEKLLIEQIFPYVGNTHTETSFTGYVMTQAYHYALKKIKEHVNANDNDAIISQYSGMTGVVNKFQRILGLKVHENYHNLIKFNNNERPVVFITHMEHHSNQTSWLETIADVEIIKPNNDGLVDLNNFEDLLKKYKNRKLKIAAVTSCSNVTGIFTPYYEISELIHKNDGYCFVDFAASGPYIDINMHPENKLKKLDAIYFSPHKFLGGPGSTGILIFDKNLYKNKIPDQPGGGTVKWTNPWGEHEYLDDIEAREDGGTPAFLQTIRASLSIILKEKMSTKFILEREHEILDILWNKLEKIENLHILSSNNKDRLGIISFYIDNLHYNLAVKLLNDKFGIQVRGGCSCAGTYGHYLLNVDKNHSNMITSKIHQGDLSDKPGWIRLSIHPIMTNKEIENICYSIEELCYNFREWSEDYIYNNSTNEYYHKTMNNIEEEYVKKWFSSL